MIYNDILLDNILDKINNDGINNLNELEKEYLNKYNKPEQFEIKNKILNNKDNNNLEILFENISNIDDYDEIKYYWYSINDIKMYDFINSFELDENVSDYDWDDLNPEIQKYFEIFLFEIGFIDD
jgi:molybdopterin converting factor small subunit